MCSFRTVSFCLRALCCLHRFKILLHKLTRCSFPLYLPFLSRCNLALGKQQLANTEMLGFSFACKCKGKVKKGQAV